MFFFYFMKYIGIRFKIKIICNFLCMKLHKVKIVVCLLNKKKKKTGSAQNMLNKLRMYTVLKFAHNVNLFTIYDKF